MMRAQMMVALACTLLVASGLAEAQLQQTTITALVVDAGDTPAVSVPVSLTDALGAVLRAAATDVHGRAVFRGITPGRYEVRTIIRGGPVQLPVVVSGALPIEILVRLPAVITDRIQVDGPAADETSSRHGIAGESLQRLPARGRARALQDAVATMPGWSTEDNGLLHARGVDDGFLYVIDGVPVYERLDALHGIAPDLGAVESINVITGYVSPEFGHKAGGVIEVRTSPADGWHATADILTGSNAFREGGGAFGGRLGAARVRAGASATRSERYLDPVHPENLHNTGGQATTFGQVEWTRAARDRVSWGWSAGGARFDVPHNDEQEAAGQDQRQHLGHGSLNGTWQRTWAAHLVTQAAAYHRRSHARLEGSTNDTPLDAHARRSLARTGVLFAATRQQGRHLLKGGFEWQRLSLDETFGFHITDPDEADEAGLRDAALAFTADDPFRFAGDASRHLVSLYVQDTWQALSHLTLSGGVRLDRSQLLLSRSQWSPRVGAAWRVNDRTLLRASLSRYFQPPQPENLLLSSSPEARVLSSIVVGTAEGGAEIEPERQWSGELGIDRRLGRMRLDAAYWLRRIRHVADPNVFAGTTIVFPNAVDRGRAHGLEVRLEVPQVRGWSAFANASAAHVRQTGPVTGGLFLEDEVQELGPGVEFSPDHDQRFTAGGGLLWQHASSGAAWTMTVRYETGTPVQQDDDDLEELLEAPGAELVDFAAGRVKPRTVVSMQLTTPPLRGARLTATASLQVLNVFDTRYAYNFGNPFSGTHFGAPRTVVFSLRVRGGGGGRD